MFVLRITEMLIIRVEINNLSRTFRSVGMVRPQNYWEDVSPAIELLSNSPYVGFVDVWHGVEGILLDFYTTDTAGMIHNLPREKQARVAEAVFTGQINSISLGSGVNAITGRVDAIVRVQLTVQEVLAGPEFLVVPGQLLLISHRSPWVNYNYLNELEGIQEGASFLFKGARYIEFAPPLGIIPSSRGQNNPMIFTSLNDAGIWFIPASDVPDDHDFSHIYGLESLNDTMSFLDHHQRTVMLQPTRDMSALPIMQRDAAAMIGWQTLGDSPFLFTLIEGRLLNYQDHTEQNHVAAVSLGFATHFHNTTGQRLHIGDTIRIGIPQEQYVSHTLPMFRDFAIRSVLPVEQVYTLELEIVGIYVDNARSAMQTGTFGNTFIYIPHSLLPDGLIIHPPSAGDVPGWMTDDYVPSIWFNFELSDAQHEQAFFAEYHQKIDAMDLELVLIEGRSQFFWATINPMLLVITFNAAVFGITLVLLTALVVVIFMQLNRKNIAIQRSLGFSKREIAFKLLLTKLFICTPPIIVGSIAAWTQAQLIASQTLEPLTEMIAGYTVNIDVHIAWLVLIIGAILILLLGLVLINLFYLYRLPVLEQLQGLTTRRKKEKVRFKKPQQDNEIVHHTGDAAYVSIRKKEYQYKRFYAVLSSLRFSYRNLSRSMIKTCLCIVFAFTFIFMLGWLNETVLRSQQAVDDLYLNTVIEGSVVQSNVMDTVDGRMFGEIIRRDTVNQLLQSGFIDHYYIEAAHFRSFILPMNDERIFPEHWHDIISYDITQPIHLNMDALDFMLSLNDLNVFLEDNLKGRPHGVSVQFESSFDAHDDFVFNTGEPIPIIISEAIATRRGISLGDDVFIGYTLWSPSAWNAANARVVGIHDGNLSRALIQSSFIIPIAAFDEMMMGMGMYSTVRFTINPELNRNIDEVWTVLDEIVSNPRAGLLSLRLVLLDQQFFVIVGTASQVLLFLQLIYPIALVISFLIACGLSMLLMLQNAKKIAILRVYGKKKHKIYKTFFIEQVALNIVGLLFSLIILIAINVQFNTNVFLSFLIYFSGIFIGTLVSITQITRKTPLEMLQVKE